MNIITAEGKRRCAGCGLPAHAHEKTRVFPDDGPSGTWHWIYDCPEDEIGDLPEWVADHARKKLGVVGERALGVQTEG